MLNYIKDSNNMDDIVFEKRNRAYGAYVLRKQYPESINRAFFYTLSGMLVLGIIAVFAGRLLGNAIKQSDQTYDKVLTISKIDVPEPTEEIYEIPKPKVEVPKPTVAPSPLPSATQNFTAMQVVPDIENITSTDVKPITDLQPDVPIGNQQINSTAEIPSTPSTSPPGSGGVSPSNADDNAAIYVEEMPEFIGGETALYSFIQRNFEYPSILRDSDISGKVIVSFVVEKDGSISNVNILRGVHLSIDNEAKRVISKLPKFKPGYQNKMPVRVKYNIPIKVELN